MALPECSATLTPASLVPTSRPKPLRAPTHPRQLQPRQRPPVAEGAGDDVADLEQREAPGGELELVVGRFAGQDAHRDDVALFAGVGAAQLDLPRQAAAQRHRRDLVEYSGLHGLAPQEPELGARLSGPASPDQAPEAHRYGYPCAPGALYYIPATTRRRLRVSRKPYAQGSLMRHPWFLIRAFGGQLPVSLLTLLPYRREAAGNGLPPAGPGGAICFQLRGATCCQ